jgi:hypothetical protein
MNCAECPLQVGVIFFLIDEDLRDTFECADLPVCTLTLALKMLSRFLSNLRLETRRMRRGYPHDASSRVSHPQHASLRR